MANSIHGTSWLERFLFPTYMTFCLGFMITFPTGSEWFSGIYQFIDSLLHPLLRLSGRVFFGFDEIPATIHSDSRSMFALVALLVMFALIAGLVFSFSKYGSSIGRWRYPLSVLLRYYVAWQLFHYGFNKVFKWQFFLPEPNTAYTYLGYVSKDLLYWSTIGSSYEFTVFAGILEVAAAALLLFRRTFKAGAFLALIVLSNVVLINFCFNISVKLFSMTLLLMCLGILAPYRHAFLRLFFNTNGSVKAIPQPDFSSNKLLYPIMKAGVILVIFIDSLLIYRQTGNWNDDLQPRSSIHGGYDVLSGNESWEQIFFHRKGYFIVKEDEKTLKDYRVVELDTVGKRLVVERRGNQDSYRYLLRPDTLFMYPDYSGDTIRAKRLPYRTLPAFSNTFTWWVD